MPLLAKIWSSVGSITLFYVTAVKVVSASIGCLARVTYKSELMSINCISIAACSIAFVHWQLLMTYINVFYAFLITLLLPVVKHISVRRGLSEPEKPYDSDSLDEANLQTLTGKKREQLWRDSELANAVMEVEDILMRWRFSRSELTNIKMVVEEMLRAPLWNGSELVEDKTADKMLKKEAYIDSIAVKGKMEMEDTLKTRPQIGLESSGNNAAGENQEKTLDKAAIPERIRNGTQDSCQHSPHDSPSQASSQDSGAPYCTETQRSPLTPSKECQTIPDSSGLAR